MSNYKWVTHSDTGKPTKGYVQLCDEGFCSIPFPKVPCYEIDELLKKSLIQSGILMEIRSDYSLEHYYLLTPRNINRVSITAPLFKVNHMTGGYDKVADSYTGTVVDPQQKIWVKEEFQRCQQTVQKAQSDKFHRLFNEKSLDGGLTACIDITARIENLNGVFCAKYLPNNFFKVCRLAARSLTGPDGTETVLFMKEMDVHGGTITIKVPERLKPLVIGSGGENIKKVAKKINARRINVV